MAEKGSDSSTTPGGALGELESFGERAGEWLARNARWVLLGAIGCLAIGGAYGAYDSWSTNREEVASEALEQTRMAYMVAMGAQPLAYEVPELANPAAAVEIRGEYAERFRVVADAHPGTVAASVALLEESDLRDPEGDGPTPIEVLERLLAQPNVGGRLRGMTYQRIAQIHEDAGRWPDAGEAHAAASEIEDYPLRFWAMTDAARCFSLTDQTERALALFSRVESEAPELNMPSHVRVRLRELEAVSLR